MAHRQKDKARRNPLGCAAPVKPLAAELRHEESQEESQRQKSLHRKHDIDSSWDWKKSPLDRSNTMRGLSWRQDVEIECENGLSHFGARGADV